MKEQLSIKCWRAKDVKELQPTLDNKEKKLTIDSSTSANLNANSSSVCSLDTLLSNPSRSAFPPRSPSNPRSPETPSPPESRAPRSPCTLMPTIASCTTCCIACWPSTDICRVNIGRKRQEQDQRVDTSVKKRKVEPKIATQPRANTRLQQVQDVGFTQ